MQVPVSAPGVLNRAISPGGRVPMVITMRRPDNGNDNHSNLYAGGSKSINAIENDYRLCY
jgi:hypothetical protein